MPTLKVFISQPMRGLSDAEILSNRNTAFNKLKKEFAENGVQISLIDNTQFDGPENAHPTYYLSNDINMMGKADFVYFLQGWEKAHGCIIEFNVAREYNIPMRFQEL